MTDPALVPYVQDFGVYIHWPYCVSKCPYCDFNSHVAQTVDHAAWKRAYEQEIKTYADMTSGRTVTSIFFGGGTPSLMPPDLVADVISAVQSNWRLSNDCEITLEANPTSVEIEKFKAFRMAGVNRVSMGVQSFHDKDLAFLGRAHDARHARAAIETAAKVFDRYSFDLIYARPQQTVQDWTDELKMALPLVRDHLSVYQLTIEKGTPFYMQHARGDFKIPDEELAGDLYEATQDILGAHGLPAYEVSNHAREGARSRHNLTYWRYNDYVGVGPGAHGRLSVNGNKIATRAHRAPDIWMEHALQTGHGSHPFEPLSRHDRFVECLMMGLRLFDGVEIARVEDEGGDELDALIAPAKRKALIEEGLLVETSDILRVTKDGMQRLNGVLSYLL